VRSLSQLFKDAIKMKTYLINALVTIAVIVVIKKVPSINAVMGL
jgi:hypothetical protein